MIPEDPISNRNNRFRTGFGRDLANSLGIGVAVGIAIGLALNNLPLGIGIGIAIYSGEASIRNRRDARGNSR
jgi:hypothetical protein